MGATDKRHGFGNAGVERVSGNGMAHIFPDVELVSQHEKFDIVLHLITALADVAASC